LTKELGTERAKVIMPYAQSVLRTEGEAMKVIKTIWPDAPQEERLKAAMICVGYELNPLMRHVFLIPFKNKTTGKVSWATVLGIQANRLIAHRAGNFSYIDNTPRVMTEKEQEITFGEVAEDRIWAITKLRDSKGSEAAGYGFWMKNETPYGVDKGNSKSNMAMLRSERQAMDRLFAGKMPQGVGVVDASYVEAEDSREVDTATGEITEADTLVGELAEGPKPRHRPAAETKPEAMGLHVPDDGNMTNPKEERQITEDESTALKEAMTKASMTAGDLGKYCNKDKGWKVDKIADLKKWQWDEIIAALQRGMA